MRARVEEWREVNDERRSARGPRETNVRRKARGVALVVAMVLLAILTLLVGAGMRMSIAEVWMAGNEQFHREAVEASSAGIEVAVDRLRVRGLLAVGEAGEVQPAGDAASFVVSMRQVGQETLLPGSSVGRFAADHIEIESVGTSSREARDVQIQGVMIVSTSNGESRFSQIEAGLSAEGAP